MIIDLTGPVPQVLEACDRCHALERLYRLIGTQASLCAACFATEHG
jgi:hypothetical protein